MLNAGLGWHDILQGMAGRVLLAVCILILILPARCPG